MKPIIKWVGGKTQLLKEIFSIKHFKNFDKQNNRYFEPFIGGAAVLLKLAPLRATINDINVQLLLVYKTIKKYPNELYEKFMYHKSKNSKDYFLKIRSFDKNENLNVDTSDKDKMIKISSRFIYLNKTCFNGMYRVNSDGYFNVPWNGNIMGGSIDKENMMNVSNYFNENDIEIVNGSFEECLTNAKKGDLVYFDPPYIPLSKTKSFTSYSAHGFTLNDQIKLMETAVKLRKKGVNVVLSNSVSEKVYEIYKLNDKNSEFEFKRINANRSINSVGYKRRGEELLIWTK